MARLDEFGVVPKRELGQNFLIDDNILDVILAQLGCVPEDVILEVGAGLGVLTRALADVAAHVHAFEVDRALAAPLAATLAGRDNVSLHFSDVLKAPLEELDPMPTLCASNLPYSVAGPFVVEALQRLPSIRLYCVMVQREVAERMAAAPGSKTYGTLSVWLQLYARIVRDSPPGPVDLLSSAQRGFVSGRLRPATAGSSPAVGAGRRCAGLSRRVSGSAARPS